MQTVHQKEKRERAGYRKVRAVSNQEEKPNQHYRMFHTLDTIRDVIIKGASGSPIISRNGEVVGMICAHEQSEGKGIYLTIEKIERLYDEIRGYHV